MLETLIVLMLLVFVFLFLFDFAYSHIVKLNQTYAASAAARGDSVGLNSGIVKKNVYIGLLSFSGKRLLPVDTVQGFASDVDFEQEQIKLFLQAPSVASGRNSVLDYERWSDIRMAINRDEKYSKIDVLYEIPAMTTAKLAALYGLEKKRDNIEIKSSVSLENHASYYLSGDL